MECGGSITVTAVTGYDANMKKTSNNKNFRMMAWCRHGIRIG
jgi:hypothetical protein